MKDLFDTLAVQYVICLANGCNGPAAGNKADYGDKPEALAPAEESTRHLSSGP